MYALWGKGVSSGPKPGPGTARADLAASFQKAVVDIVVAKCRQALAKTGCTRLAVGGGVCANRSLRSELEQMARGQRIDLFIPPFEFCTDNAAMAAIAVEKWKQRDFATFDLDAEPTYLPKRK